MDIQIAKTDAEITECYPVLKALRPDLSAETFVSKIRDLQTAGYLLAYAVVIDSPVAVAGFRLGESLAWKRYLYVEDLATLDAERSKGYGANLLSWLMVYAGSEGCETLHLDSGVQRKDAHRFYQREGMRMASYHFSTTLLSKPLR